ncbi:MAG TPA: helicase-related protein [Spirochaetia bacterium]|nr:helicase-related protein [Spirochaetia bacterium]
MTILRDTSTGGILVFLPGQARIEDAAELIEEKKLSIDPRNEIPVIPIYRKIGEKEVIRRFNQLGKKRRVILATDIAETAHTLEDVLYVIDSGYIRQHRWDPLSETSSLPVVRHSQAGCKQRWGRVGRVKRGYVYALYTKDEFDMFDEQTEPEVRRSNLEEYVLTLRSAGMMQSVPVIGASEGEGPLKTELARATRALETTGLLNREGDITEKGLEFFRVPLGAFEKALLDSADEQNCLLEMLTVLMMMQSREGEIRTGAGLYSRTGGLLVWDSRWSAATKLRVHRAQQSLFFGCDDDLDFVLSLASQFEEAENAGIGREWSAFYFVNYDNLKTVCERRDEVLDIYRARTKDQESRRLELGLIARARSALVVLLESTKPISLSQAGNSLEFTQKAGSQNGIISPNCVGSWQAGDKAVLLAATRTKAIIGGQLAVGTVGSFLVRPLFQRIDNARACALTRAYPTGAKVMIAEDGVFRVVGRTTSPPSIDVSYRDEMTFGGLSEDAARRKILGKFSWPAPASVGSFSMPALWDASSQPGGTGEALMSRVEGLGDGLTAVVTSVDAQRLGYQDIRGKREGDTLEATVVEVFRDPDYYGRGGWALVKTRQGFEIPVELAALSMDFNGFGLERLVGTTMNLRVDEVRCGVPRLSQFDALASDLRSLAVRLGQEPLIRATGFIEHVDPQRSEVFVSVLRPGNLIHVFQIDKVGIAGIIDNLGIGESVEIALGLSRRREVFQSYYSPRPHELQSLPRKAGWRFDKKHARLVIPLGLSANDLEGWTANRDTKQRVLRTSWRYRFNASIVGRAAYDDIKVGQEVFGIVVELERGTVGSLKRIWVRVPVGAAFLRGSVASSDFAAAVAPATSSPLEPSLGQKLRLVVSHVDSSAWQVQLREPSHDDTVSQLPV